MKTLVTLTLGLTLHMDKTIKTYSLHVRCHQRHEDVWDFCTDFINVFKHHLLIKRIEQFSNECRTTRTKVITQANHKGHRQSTQSK